VHVWRASLDLPDGLPDSLARTLSQEELDRSGRLRFENLRRRSLASRAILREIISRYAGIPPAAVELSAGKLGKPALAPACAAAAGGLRFNMSHSEALALYAFALGREVGVDVERLRPEASRGIAERFFSPREAEEIAALGREGGEPLRERAFFACWTRKEAYLKARGEGLTAGLKRFEVTADPRKPPRLSISGDPAESARPSPAGAGAPSPKRLWRVGDFGAQARWEIVDLDAAEGFAAAVAVESAGAGAGGGAGGGLRLVTWEWRAPGGV
jgi:4'-phosphopantetheinyl transferase